MVFVAFAALYLTTTPSLANQHWDSLEYASVCESRGPLSTWGNHPLGQSLQCGVFEVARAAGYRGRALPVLEAGSAVAAAGAVAALFALLAGVLRLPRVRALGWTVVVGATHGLWHYAGTADIYGAALLSLVIAHTHLLRSVQSPGDEAPWRTSAVLALAALVHQFNAVLLAVGLAGFATVGGRRADGSRLWGLAWRSAFLTAAGYLILGALAMWTLHPTPIVQWIAGYGRDPLYGHSFGLDAAGPAVHSIGDTFLRDPWSGPGRPWWIAAVAAGTILTLAAAFVVRRLPEDRRRLAIVSAAQCLVGWSLISWWWPVVSGKWWIQTLPFLIVWWDGVFEQGQKAEGRRQRAEGGRQKAEGRGRIAALAPLVAGLALAAFNYQFAMRVERQPDTAFEQGVAAWVEHSAPDDLLIENGRLTATLLFWSGRPQTMNVNRLLQAGRRAGDSLAAVRARIDTALAQHRRVLFAASLDPYFYTDDRLRPFGITRQDLIDCFDRYRRAGPLFSYEAWPGAPPTMVYQLEPPADGI